MNPFCPSFTVYWVYPSPKSLESNISINLESAPFCWVVQGHRPERDHLMGAHPPFSRSTFATLR